MIDILLVVSGSALLLFLLLLLIRLRYEHLTREIWRSLKTQSSGNIFSAEVFTKEMVASLDEPVQRYFLHAIEVGTPLASCVELKMNGSCRFKPNANWLAMQASQIISIAPGFIWRANISKGSINFSSVDYYSRGKGRTKFSFWSLIPLVDVQSKDVARSVAGRLGAEYIWLPSALLPHHGVVWKVMAQNTIQADFSINSEPICLTLTIDRDGKLLELSQPRWGNITAEESWQYSIFIADIEEEQTFAGYTIPAKINAGWFEYERYWILFLSTLKQANFY